MESPMMTEMTISKAARNAGVGIETIRFYERKGLIEQPLKPQDGGYRTYPIETVERIKFVRQAQEIGFSLREIDELLSLRADPSADCSDVRERAAAKLEEVDRKMARLGQIRSALNELIAACPGRGALGTCSIMVSLVAAPGETRVHAKVNRKEKAG
jgi:MerR family mercuric resistance operon transcriptional regulator